MGAKNGYSEGDKMMSDVFCPGCNQPLFSYDYVTDRKTGVISVILACENGDCENYGKFFHIDRSGRLMEGLLQWQSSAFVSTNKKTSTL